jgi:hypothetical protein
MFNLPLVKLSEAMAHRTTTSHPVAVVVVWAAGAVDPVLLLTLEAPVEVVALVIEAVMALQLLLVAPEGVALVELVSIQEQM